MRLILSEQNQLAFTQSTFLPLQYFLSLKVHQCRFENHPICSCSYKNNTLKILHPHSEEFSSYSPVKFVFFLKSRLLFNVCYCVCLQSLRSRIIRIKNAKLSGYYFDINWNLYGDFQICISVLLITIETVKLFFLGIFSINLFSRK